MNSFLFLSSPSTESDEGNEGAFLLEGCVMCARALSDTRAPSSSLGRENCRLTVFGNWTNPKNVPRDSCHHHARYRFAFDEPEKWSHRFFFFPRRKEENARRGRRQERGREGGERKTKNVDTSRGHRRSGHLFQRAPAVISSLIENIPLERKGRGI